MEYSISDLEKILDTKNDNIEIVPDSLIERAIYDLSQRAKLVAIASGEAVDMDAEMSDGEAGSN